MIEFLNKEGRNRTNKWNDYCGCYAQRFDEVTQRMILQEEELTFGCGGGGKLIGCTFCFNVTHSSCCGLGDQRKNAPRGDWACPVCMDHVREQLKNDDVVDSVSVSEEEERNSDDSVVEDKPVEWIENTQTTRVHMF